MKTVNVFEAKIRFLQLLGLAASGEEVIIARAGKPMAKLIPYRIDKLFRKRGYWRGKLKFPRILMNSQRIFPGLSGERKREFLMRYPCLALVVKR